MSNILNEHQILCNNSQAAFTKVIQLLRRAGSAESPIHELERDLVSAVLNIGLAALQDFVEAAGDGDQGEQMTVNAQQVKRSPKKQKRIYRSVFGNLAIERFTYSLREKTKALAKPLDQKLGLPGQEVSYVLEDWVTSLSVEMPFESVTTWLKSTLGIKISPTTAHRRIEELGNEVEGFNEQRAPVPTKDEKQILVALADGKGVPIRTSFPTRAHQELGIPISHRPARQDAGIRAKNRSTVGDKNVKTQRATAGAFYSVDPFERTASELLEGQNDDRPLPANKRLWAELNLIGQEGVSRGAVRVFESLAQERLERDPHHRKPMVCLMDGDQHLWTLQREYLPDAIGILDLYHMTEKLWLAAQCFHKQGSREAESLVAKYLKMMLENKVDCVRGLLKRELNRETLNKTKQQQLQSVYKYLTDNRQRMRYGDYLAQGFPIGSGVIEGACKHVIGDRMCGTGMRWEFEGAQPMLDMRVTKLNGQWNQFIQYRTQKEQARLYQNAA